MRIAARAERRGSIAEGKFRGSYIYIYLSVYLYIYIYKTHRYYIYEKDRYRKNRDINKYIYIDIADVGCLWLNHFLYLQQRFPA